MKLKQLFTDDDAVSPVIGVILMVAITVILAAVIGTFVLGLGDQVSENAPQASFTFDWDGTDTLTITHDGGDGIEAAKLSVIASGSTVTCDWGVTKVTAGDNCDATVTSSDTVRVIWEGSSDSATIGKWTGPDA